MTATILAAGDHFCLPGLFAEALRAEVGDEPEIREHTSGWPHEPFGDVAEVTEAAGDEDELIAGLEGARACVTQLAPLTERMLAACPDLELFAIGRGGPVNANLEAATRHGVAVTFAPGRNAAATAEYTVGMILAALRRIADTHRSLVGGEWKQSFYAYDEVGLEIGGSTVGLVGCGAIGSRVAGILRAFGADVLVHDPFVEPDALGEGVRKVELAELLERSRIVTLHARLTEETAGLIGAGEIAAMPAGSAIVNCARGGLLDYDALCDALDSGHLLAAGLDVFPEEPIPDGSRLLRTPNVVLTPHLAGASRQTAENAARLVAAEVGRLWRGEPLAHVANPG